MSVLVLLLAPRARLAAGPGAAEVSTPTPKGEVAYALSADGAGTGRQGQAAPALLPRADSVVAVLSPADVSWQRITLPKAPASKLRAALEGLLEENLLEETSDLHFALAPGAQAGQEAWVAVMNRAWLSGELAALEQAGVIVDRVVPAHWPVDPPLGHFFDGASTRGGEAQPALSWADARGVANVALSGTLARALLDETSIEGVRFTAVPSVATAAERWLGRPVAVLTETEAALRAADSEWNLRQFDLAARHRGAVALRQVARRLKGPAWRPVRWGIAALVGVHLVGVNAWAWSQRQAVESRRQAQAALLKATHPQVRAVLDAPTQMQRETDSLRSAAGRAGEADLESMLATAAAAWPDGQGPMQGLKFEPGRLTLTVAGWSEDHVRQFRDRLRPAGWAVEVAAGKVTMQRPGRSG